MFDWHLCLKDMNPDEPYPVMVFWHGGAFTTGSTIQYPGHFLAARDVIVVNSNYRLGIFGEKNKKSCFSLIESSCKL